MGVFAVAAIGADRPGIVATIGGALLTAGASIEDSSMTILGGQFAMLFIVHADCTQADLQSSLAVAASDLDLVLEICETQPATHQVAMASYTIAAYGPDRPGLVVALARILADAAANITDFGSRLTPSGVFAMWFNADLPAGIDVDELADRLRGAGEDVSLDVSIHPQEQEAL